MDLKELGLRTGYVHRSFIKEAFDDFFPIKIENRFFSKSFAVEVKIELSSEVDAEAKKRLIANIVKIFDVVGLNALISEIIISEREELKISCKQEVFMPDERLRKFTSEEVQR